MNNKKVGMQSNNVLFKSNKAKSCPLSTEEGGAIAIDYKDPKKLRKFISARGRKMPSRITYISAKKQRQLSNAIDRARYLALLPYVSLEG